MSKNEYLAELKGKLMGLQPDERDSAIKYYEEFFEDAGESNEQSVIMELGTPASLAKSIIGDYNRTETSSSEYVPANLNSTAKNKTTSTAQNSTSSNNGWKIAAIVLICIFALPLTIAIFGILVGIFGAIFGIVVGFGAATIALIVSGIACFIAGIVTIFVNPILGLAGMGCGLVIFALGLLMLIPCILIIVKTIPWIIKGIVNIFYKIFHKKAI